jgi:PmbA protein
MGSSAFDGDGVATRAQAFVADGVVASYVLGTYSARRLGLVTTGNASGVHNLDIQGPTVPADDLRRDMGTGFLVTEMMGQGVNMVTGDYSRGAAGFWVENGEIAYPVEEATIASNLADMLMHVAAVGDDRDMRGNVRAPSILVDGMTVAGIQA